MTNHPAPSVRNITRVFRAADASQLAAGLDWYADAHKVAQALATQNDVPLTVSSGVIAALSPLNGWGANVNLASRFLATPGGLTSGYLTLGLGKARRILAGESPAHVLGGLKITAFYHAILSAGMTNEAVVVDRHAYSLATNVRYTDDTMPTLKGRRYGDTADCYRRAARILSREADTPVYAAQVQAVTWVTWRHRFWARGAFDSHTVEL
jgi:hypothetical protein